jgi:hypothetical protein
MPEDDKEEHGDDFTGMHTSDMLDEKGKPIFARETMTTEQTNALRQAGREGGQVTESGIGRI